MAYSPNVWSQIKNLTADHLISALRKDGWTKDAFCKGTSLVFVKKRNPRNDRIGIHYHPRKTYGPNLLKGLLADIGWSENDFRRLKLIK